MLYALDKKCWIIWFVRSPVNKIDNQAHGLETQMVGLGGVVKVVHFHVLDPPMESFPDPLL